MNTLSLFFFFFNDTATTEIYTLSLHDALPICAPKLGEAEVAALGDHLAAQLRAVDADGVVGAVADVGVRDRKSTRLNSSHSSISYAVFCLKKKKKKSATNTTSQIHTLDPRLVS